MHITYLDHSGFIVELAKHILVFDYVLGELPDSLSHKPIYFFVSHAHSDHAHPQLTTLLEKSDQALGIVSDDVVLDCTKQAIMVGPDQCIEVDGLQITTYPSTDEGVAFLVHVEEKYIYHAGDLHWWDWEEDSKEDRQAMQAHYMQAIEKLKDISIDLAFLVLDPRQEKNYWMGFHTFMTMHEVKLAVPMHCWGQYSLMDTFLKLPCSEAYRNQIITYHETGTIYNEEARP